MSTETIFIRLTSEKNKAEALNAALIGQNEHLLYTCDHKIFSAIQGSPFSYWVSKNIRKCFTDFPIFENENVSAKVGLQTSDDSRFVRVWWEINTCLMYKNWYPFAKGGNYSPYYSNIKSIVNWANNGSQLRSYEKAYIRNESNYFHSGLTWPLRTHRFSPNIMPDESIFSIRGYAIICPNEERKLSILAVCNSFLFDYLFKMALGRFGHPEFVVGVLQNLPFPEIDSDDMSFLAIRAREIWSIKQQQDQSDELSHIFILPELLLANGCSLSERSLAWVKKINEWNSTIEALQNEIDDKCWNAYGIQESDKYTIIDPPADWSSEEEAPQELDGEEDEYVATPSEPFRLAERLASWLFGSALGRWDVDLATSERPIPPLPGPFDKLPPVSRGMLLGADGLHPAKDATGRFLPEHDLLLDDEGENLDLVRRVREALECVAGERADAWLLELEGLLGADLRTWYRRTFFEQHLRRYSKSKRKAPIYWQLGTPSGSYSVWLYYPRLTRDSLFRLLNDVVKPKVAYEEQRLAGMREQNARRSELEPQEALVEELQAFRDEVARVTPLFDPNLDDGVLINAAPLHRLFVHAGWRRDTQTAWTQLVRGDFEWSHMALHLWPERVVPQCAEQRHLALAHDLEEPLKTRSVEDLVAAHTRPAVKEALQALLNASPQAGGRSAGRPARAPRAPRPAPEPRAAAEPTPRVPRAIVEVSEATLAAIRDALARFPGGAAKSDVLSATGIPDGTWNTAIAQLLATGDVERQGEKRGTRYFLVRR